MPKYGIEDTPEDLNKPKLACAGLRDDLKACLVNSDCVQKVRPCEQEPILQRLYGLIIEIM